MATYDPPNEIVPIFNPENWIIGGQEALTLADGDARYLKLTGGVEKGSVLFNQGLVSNTVQGTNNNNVVVESLGTGDVVLRTGSSDRVVVDDSTGRATFNVGVITNSLRGTTNNNLVAESIGSGSILLRTNNTARLTVNNNGTITCSKLLTGLEGVNTTTMNADYAKCVNALEVDGTMYADVNTGNVGFGTLTPTERVDVVGEVNIGASNTYRIGGTPVIDATSLGPGIVNSSLEVVGDLQYLKCLGQLELGANIRMGNINIGLDSGMINKAVNSIAIGQEAGLDSQGGNAIAIGNLAGKTSQHSNSIILNATGSVLNSDGTNRTFIDPIRQATSTTATVLNYNTTTKEVFHSPAGVFTDFTSTGTATMANIRMNPIKIGVGAGFTNQSPTGTIAVGFNAGAGSQDQFSIAIGHTAGNANQALRCIAIGHQAGQNQQQNDGVAIGYQAGNSRQNPGSVAIGYLSGKNTQGQNSVSIGSATGEIFQGRESVAVGASAGRNTQGQNAIAIGTEAGEESQKSGAIALGYFSGNTNQGVSAISIGDEAGRTNQGQNAISIGYFSGRFNQASNTVAIGTGAGQTNQGSTSVAIGQNAGRNNQHANSIVINASGLDTNTDGTNRTFIRPIRGVAHGLGVGVLRYDTTTFEITYSTN